MWMPTASDQSRDGSQVAWVVRDKKPGRKDKLHGPFKYKANALDVKINLMSKYQNDGERLFYVESDKKEVVE
jgi:hypothetical protein